MNPVKAAIPLSHKLQDLPQEPLTSLEHPESFYGAGWIFGREMFGDNPDPKKASFYFNPLSYDPNPPTRKEYPWILPDNLWPSQELSELQHECKPVCTVMDSVKTQLAKRIDPLGYGAKISEEMETSLMSTGRILYYYPTTEAEVSDSTANADGWIDWDKDSGFWTVLAPRICTSTTQRASRLRIRSPRQQVCGLQHETVFYTE